MINPLTPPPMQQPTPQPQNHVQSLGDIMRAPNFASSLPTPPTPSGPPTPTARPTNPVIATFAEVKPLWPAAVECQKRYGSKITDLATIFAPQYQQVVARDPDKCMTDPNVPSLSVVVNAYGLNGTVGWIMAQMEDLNRVTGGHDKADARELQSAAEAIVVNYPYLRLTDIMLFFSRFKAGLYGRFYGKTDTMVITTALSQYAIWRKAEMERIERAQNQVAQLMAQLRNFSRAQFSIDELRISPLWAQFTDHQKQCFMRLAAQRDTSKTWDRYKFTFCVRQYIAPNGKKETGFCLDPNLHSEDEKLLFQTPNPISPLP